MTGEAPLSTRHQHIALITGFTARGEQERLDAALRHALDGGLTVNEIKEIFIHAYTYLGFPRAIWGSYVAMNVVADRAASGIEDEIGRESTPLQIDDRRAFGQRLMEQVTGITPDQLAQGVMGFNPVIETLLQEHLFADVVARDALSVHDHELVTLTALLCNQPMETISTESHLVVARRVGFSPAQLEQLLALIDDRIDAETAAAGRGLL